MLASGRSNIVAAIVLVPVGLHLLGGHAHMAPAADQHFTACMTGRLQKTADAPHNVDDCVVPVEQAGGSDKSHLVLGAVLGQGF